MFYSGATWLVRGQKFFLIQNSQNRDSAAMHAKLDELIFAMRHADAGFIDIEHLTDHELAAILAEVEKRAGAIHAGHAAHPVRSHPAKRLDDVTR